MESIGMIMIASMAYFMSLQEGGVSSVVPVLGALALGAQRILPALQQLYGAYISINGSHASVNDVLILLEQPLPSNIDLLGNQSIEFNKCIYLKDVGFKYPGNERRVIKNIDLKIKKGSIVGFMGPTGSGKSTLLDILMGLLNPTSGGIYIDNVKVDKNNQYLWQKNIAHVPQNIFLSDGSIEENIALGVPIGEIDTIRVKDAARQAQLDKVIENLPCGYQTIIGEDGNFLSGGQKQRIGIARAIYKRAQVLIFDEATSALDTKTEAEIMKSIYSLGENLTILIIAHRVSTLKGCDWLVKITNGKSEIVKSDQEVFK
jgi:ATP-binding cassette subfamily B protein